MYLSSYIEYIINERDLRYILFYIKCSLRTYSKVIGVGYVTNYLHSIEIKTSENVFVIYFSYLFVINSC